MLREMCKSKIHHARVTETELFYSGSITIDADLIKEANILPNEKVQVVNLNNGTRVETYVVPGEAGSGVICMNGAAARWAQKGDIVIIISYCLASDEEINRGWKPAIIVLDEQNKIKERL